MAGDPVERRNVHVETLPGRMRELAAGYDELSVRLAALLRQFSDEVDAVARLLEGLVAVDESAVGPG